MGGWDGVENGAGSVTQGGGEAARNFYATDQMSSIRIESGVLRRVYCSYNLKSIVLKGGGLGSHHLVVIFTSVARISALGRREILVLTLLLCCSLVSEFSSALLILFN